MGDQVGIAGGRVFVSTYILVTRHKELRVKKRTGKVQTHPVSNKKYDSISDDLDNGLFSENSP